MPGCRSGKKATVPDPEAHDQWRALLEVRRDEPLWTSLSSVHRDVSGHGCVGFGVLMLVVGG